MNTILVYIVMMSKWWAYSYYIDLSLNFLLCWHKLCGKCAQHWLNLDGIKTQVSIIMPPSTVAMPSLQYVAWTCWAPGSQLLARPFYSHSPLALIYPKLCFFAVFYAHFYIGGEYSTMTPKQFGFLTTKQKGIL